jgi:hypothetical protein
VLVVPALVKLSLIIIALFELDDERFAKFEFIIEIFKSFPAEINDNGKINDGDDDENDNGPILQLIIEILPVLPSNKQYCALSLSSLIISTSSIKIFPLPI